MTSGVSGAAAAEAPGTETMSGAARRYGVDGAAVRKWRDQGAPFRQIGRNWVCDPAALDEWCRDNGRGTGAKRRRVGSVVGAGGPAAKFEGDNSELDRELREAELRRRQADAEKRETENRRRSGELVPRAEVEEIEAGRLVAIRSGLLALGVKIAARLAHLGEQQEVEGIVDAECRVLLDAYADGRNYPEEGA